MKLKASGFFPFYAVLLLFYLSHGEKLVEVVVPIAKLHFLPSASSDTRGYIRQGQRYVVDGESGLWYRIRLYGATLWVAKDAVSVLETVSSGSKTAVGQAPKGGAESSRTGRQDQQPPPAPSAKAAPAKPGSPDVAPAERAQQAFVSPESGESFSWRKPPPHRQPPAAAKPKASSPESLSRAMFSDFSHVSRLPIGESGKEITFFQISSNETPVYSLSANDATVLTKVKKGDYFPFLEGIGSWCKIALNDTAGWVERSKGVIVSAPKSRFMDDFLFVLIVAAVLLAAAIVVVTALFLRRKYRTKTRRTEPFHALIIAKSVPSVQCIISNKTISLEKYLVVIGFTVKTIHDLGSAQKSIAKYAADAVFIDWNISDDIPGAVEVIFAGYEAKKLPLAIFFNVPDVSDVPMIPILPRAYHLGELFSDHDISKLITPTMLSRTNPRSGAASALEGDIAEGNLPEILQFIEIGKKNGCLLVETESPIGMIYFKQGRIIHAAAANGITGRRAITSLLGLRQGKFRFLLNKQPKTVDLNISILEVLMEWTKAEDETHRD